MAKKTKYCWDCSTEFKVVCAEQGEVNYCPFCGASIAGEDEVLLDDEAESD